MAEASSSSGGGSGSGSGSRPCAVSACARRIAKVSKSVPPVCFSMLSLLGRLTHHGFRDAIIGAMMIPHVFAGSPLKGTARTTKKNLQH